MPELHSIDKDLWWNVIFSLIYFKIFCQQKSRNVKVKVKVIHWEACACYRITEQRQRNCWRKNRTPLLFSFMLRHICLKWNLCALNIQDHASTMIHNSLVWSSLWVSIIKHETCCFDRGGLRDLSFNLIFLYKS